MTVTHQCVRWGWRALSVYPCALHARIIEEVNLTTVSSLGTRPYSRREIKGLGKLLYRSCVLWVELTHTRAIITHMHANGNDAMYITPIMT